MLYLILLIVAIIIGGYFVIHYFMLLYAMHKISEDIEEIQQDLTQNHMIDLPLPDRHLRELLCSINSTLEAIRKERQTYQKRERDFQQQIENISHDLRTPLTVILGYLKLFKKSQTSLLSSNTDLSETVDIVEHKAEIMKDLVSQFYDYSRMNAGDFEIVLNKMDLCRTLRESLMGNYPLLEQYHLKTKVELPEHPVWVIGDPSSFERIFNNLLQNAGRYANSFLHIKLEESKGMVTISFINDTNLLSEPDISHLFDRFYMQDSSRNQGGTGLGLTVAKSLAKEMNAILKVNILDKQMKHEPLTISFDLQIKSLEQS